ncbi:hypothetical protein RFI_21106 [Reticulomyxa filosa]|uniref:Transcription initiation factor TFIID subunit 12 domain-containing protein n=1 Tax=Reticulomyxa filosa TaxID=46433 RepID=X6MQW0_RETFI|nr:hypothetical protein RFI_21106 [Reticulomyxa filosa]|eukprot:ETO16249.1 hypothetical protein RFI_21106 [Reticulomyxa filosa]
MPTVLMPPKIPMAVSFANGTTNSISQQPTNVFIRSKGLQSLLLPAPDVVQQKNVSEKEEQDPAQTPPNSSELISQVLQKKKKRVNARVPAPNYLKHSLAQNLFLKNENCVSAKKKCLTNTCKCKDAPNNQQLILRKSIPKLLQTLNIPYNIDNGAQELLSEIALHFVRKVFKKAVDYSQIRESTYVDVKDIQRALTKCFYTPPHQFDPDLLQHEARPNPSYKYKSASFIHRRRLPLMNKLRVKRARLRSTTNKF